jgi:hypothetical protein
MKKIFISIFTAASVLFCGTAFAETACTDPAAPAVPAVKKTVKRTRTVWRTASPPVKVEFEAKEASAYKIVAEPQPPKVVRGLFRDRVIQPRRQKLSVVTE